VPELISISTTALKPVVGRPLQFTAPVAGTNAASVVRLVPFYELHHERYTLYWHAH
jgi:hypothetical protein